VALASLGGLGWSEADAPLRGSAIHAVAVSAGAEQSDYRFEDENQTVGGRFFGKR